MATAHWRTGYTVADLFSLPDADWSFHQLVRLLLGMGINDSAILESLQAKVDFKSTLSHSLPPGEIRNVIIAENTKDDGVSEKHRVECAHYNLTGIDGPLAEPFLDILRQDVRYGDGAMAAFMDLFNNRIHALRYFIHAETNLTLTNGDAANNFVGQFLLALSGHYYQEQRDFHGQLDDTLLSLSGHLANCRMSLPIVRKLFHTVLGLPVIKMNSIIGRWLTVQKSDHTVMGQSNCRLGQEATLGKRIWDQQAVFELVLGPMSLQRRSQLLPGGVEHHNLKDLIAWISESRCDCKVTLDCEPDAAPEKNATTLSCDLNLTNRLGYGAALKSDAPKSCQVSFMLDLVN
ncbi:hypothetical protein tinsulaeT_37170 [Thalassotalea insulae]|uniref:Type VI secretion system baseplate subunit TssG n=1 Tax=Thalassotalea insulae TaxID=2056778 RepID=A0ABQ6GYG8_9GAMM|nr:type VI secretion system baseplate subunit TssG [Thalassotalea insulae]GLX80377.1 hypothetical protein tinsulaeT_37170 [Thalassotalea insulae]